MKRVSKKWYIMFPQDSGALGPIEFEKPVGERVVREWTRNWEGVRRLPNGFQCWPTNYPNESIFWR